MPLLMPEVGRKLESAATGLESRLESAPEARVALQLTAQGRAIIAELKETPK